jgi:hypothetical protein
MNLPFFTSQLVDNAVRIEAMVEGVSQEDAQWKPDPESWSILEVINHLYDEERLDFRIRLDIILHHSDKPWPPIDPQGWVTERQYSKRDLGTSIDAFRQERDASLEWLHGLKNPDWDKSYQAPFGSITAGDMFVAWVTHDHLHMRQFVELHRALTEREAAPYRLIYAGEW